MRISFLSSLVPARPFGRGSATSINARKLIFTTLATLCALTGVLALASTPAFAASHALAAKPIGHAGEGPGGLSEPGGVAVNESKGLLYVADVGNDRVDEFETDGTFVRAWGGGVADGASAFEECTSTCRKGVSGSNPGEFERPASIAVDNDLGSPSFGDVYVADGGSHGVVDKFSATGVYINQLTESKPGQSLEGEIGITIGPNGELWLIDFSEGRPRTSDFSNATNNAYIATRSNGIECFLTVCNGASYGATAPGLAVNSAEDFYLDIENGDLGEFAGSGELINNEIDRGRITGIAAEPATGTSSVYVDNVDSVARFSSGGVFDERFGAGQLTGGAGLAVSSATGDVYVAEGATSVVDVYENTPSAPGVEGEAVAGVSALSATLSANVNTDGLPTSYTIEYGTSVAYGQVAKTGTIPGSYDGLVAVSATLEELLRPETTYHFRVVATNADGTEPGGDVTFSTLSDFPGLPDGRGFEMVSPIANADGNVYEPRFVGFGVSEATTLPMHASASGDAVEYVADPLATGGNGSVGDGHGNEFVATRAPGGGWSAVDLETPGLDKSPFEELFPNGFANSGTSAVPADSYVLVQSPGAPLYESSGGRLSPVSVLPGGEVVDGSPAGGSHVVSADGSRIFWSAGNGHVYVREDGERTVAVSVGAAEFVTASPDGRYAFYREGERLWRFDTEDGSVEELVGEGAGLLEVLGVNETGEDGSYVYFIADGVLGDGAEHGAVAGECKANPINDTAEGSCNMYVLHGGVTTFITVLAAEDLYASTGNEVYVDLGPGSGAEVSADGQAIVFQVTASLAGHEGQGTPQIYVYDAVSGGLSCVSCDPTGEVGSSAILREGSSGWISEDGNRVFFESYGALVAQDTNGQLGVYEWEREGAGSCSPRLPARPSGGCIYLLSGGTGVGPSYFLGASASGNDVFIISRAQLTAQDQGETYEVYDARVGAVEPPAEPKCTGTGCQGLPSAPPPFATPSSVTFDGVGNFPGGTGANPPAVVKPKTKTVKCAKGKTPNKHNQCVKSKKQKAKAKSAHINRRAPR